MGITKQTAAERNYKILVFLFRSGQWENIQDIGINLETSQNYSRLKEDMDALVKRKIIEDWDSLPKFKKDDEENSGKTSKIKRKNNYKITSLGIEKLNKIRDDCLDPETRIILKMERAKED